jgi:muramoyltetrapeptide carboxypeptidase
MEDVFELQLEPLGVPILHNLPLGHGDHLCTIPLGVTATVDADARTLAFSEAALEAPTRRRRIEDVRALPARPS